MEDSVVMVKIRLQSATNQDGDQWVASCIPLDVVTQGDTKEEANRLLQEAVELWFESCIARNTLDKALLEAGFRRAGTNEEVSPDASVVAVGTPKKAGRKEEFVEVSIPAYIAAQQPPAFCATR